MKAFDRAIAKFCYKHPGFGIRRLMLYVVAGNILVFLLEIMDTTGTLLSYFCFSPALILRGQVWRLVSFIFIPTDFSPIWLAVSLYFYYFVGSSLEEQWGTGRFTLYYLCGVVLNIIFGFVLYFCGFDALYYSLSAFYINMSMFFAFAALWPNHRVLFMFFIPIKIKWLAYLDGILFIYEIISGISYFPLNLEPAVAFIGFLLFCGYDLLHPLFARLKPQKGPAYTNFKKVVNQERNSEAKPYRHKCSVCGRTDTDYPNLEFRYCSKCAGYHCFCEDHINSHIHFTE